MQFKTKKSKVIILLITIVILLTPTIFLFLNYEILELIFGFAFIAYFLYFLFKNPERIRYLFNDKLRAYVVMKSKLISKSKQDDEANYQILNKFFFEHKLKDLNQIKNKEYHNIITYWSEVFKIAPFQLIEVLRNEPWSEKIEEKFESILFGKGFLVENNVITDLPKKEYYELFINKGVELVESYKKGNHTAQLFTRIGFFVFNLNVLVSQKNTQKEKLKTWKEEVGKRIEIPDDFANNERLITNPFVISGTWTADSVAADAKKIYDFFKENEIGKALSALKVELEINKKVKSRLKTQLNKDFWDKN